MRTPGILFLRRRCASGYPRLRESKHSLQDQESRVLFGRVMARPSLGETRSENSQEIPVAISNKACPRSVECADYAAPLRICGHPSGYGFELRFELFPRQRVRRLSVGRGDFRHEALSATA